MSQSDNEGLLLGRERPARWAIVAFSASCAFTGGALLLLMLTWLA